MICAVLALVTATVHPAAPRVGDLVIVDFSAPVVVQPSADFEVVRRSPRRVVVRTFTPKPFVVTGTSGDETVQATIPIRSVLRPEDPMQPAPLAPPRAMPYPRAPFVAIAIAALAALAAWLALWIRTKAPIAGTGPRLSPDERFRRAVFALQQNASHPRRWAALADATRVYLSATRAGLGSELTTTELVPRLAGEEQVVERILRQGDLEKFSTAGAGSADFEELSTGAIALIPVEDVPA